MEQSLKNTPLTEIHRDLGAKIVDFAGFAMPVRYGSLLEEHRTVRDGVGLFDLCHMGRITIKGQEAEKFLQKITTANIEKMQLNQASYGFILNPQGKILDDIIIYRRKGDYFLVCNASNTDKIWNWLQEHGSQYAINLANISDTVGMIAIQGKHAQTITSKLTKADLSSVKYYYGLTAEIMSENGYIARTGYTGEDGFEIYLSNEKIQELWNQALIIGKEYSIMPIGLGARDTLRLEASMPLYGHEIDETTNPLEAGLDFAAKLEKEDFIGKEALMAAKKAGIQRKLVCMELEGKRIARQGSQIFYQEKEVGKVTSGTFSPSLGKSIAMGYVAMEHTKIGTELEVQISKKRYPLQVVKTPFYKRGA